MNNSEQAQANDSLSDSQIKRVYRELANTWHPDKAAELGFSSPPEEIFKVIGNWNAGVKAEKITTLNRWPSEFTDDTQVTFPAMKDSETGAEYPARTIYIPRTPNDFFTLLNFIKNNKAFPQKEYPKVKISRNSGHDDVDRERDNKDNSRAVFDAEFSNFVESLQNNASIDDLILKAGAIAVLPPGYAEQNNLYKIIDGQGEYIFNAELGKVKTKSEIVTLLRKVDQFPFSDDSLKPKVMLLASKLIKDLYMQKMKNANSEQGLKTLETELDQIYSQFNLNTDDKNEVVTWIDKKRTSYGRIWSKKGSE